jgi:5'-3' exonuclease
MIAWDENVLAFDTSFMVFHEYFSAVKNLPTCTFAGVPGDVDEAAQLQRKMRAFEAKLHDVVVSKARAYGTPMSNVVFLMDCPRNAIWRKALLPGYKESRARAASFDASAFTHTRERILPAFAREGAHVLSCDTAEADDMAAGLARAAKRRGAKSVVILTGDSDFAQLVDGAVRVHDLYNNCLLTKQGVFDPQLALLRKVLTGDKADNIPPVRARMGPKTAADVADDPGALATLLECPVVAAAYARNRALIDLNAAPAVVLLAVDAVFAAL